MQKGFGRICERVHIVWLSLRVAPDRAWLGWIVLGLDNDVDMQLFDHVANGGNAYLVELGDRLQSTRSVVGLHYGLGVVCLDEDVKVPQALSPWHQKQPEIVSIIHQRDRAQVLLA